MIDEYRNSDSATPSRKYSLRPDIVLRNAESLIIMDTKWKMLMGNYTSPAQSDIYQMYAYFTRYTQQAEKIERVILLYPQTEDSLQSSFISHVSGTTNDVQIESRFIDLFGDVEQQLKSMFEISE